MAWVLAAVFLRFCEDNGLVDEPLLSGPGDRRQRAEDHRGAWFAEHPAAGDREWLEEVVRRVRVLPGLDEVFGDHSPLWLFGPSADGARALLETWWRLDAAGTGLRHDFTDPELDTRFLGDLYQDVSAYAKQMYALLQTPEFVESFILDRALDPALDEHGVEGFTMIDPACGSGHFLLGAFARVLARRRRGGAGSRADVEAALKSVHGVDVNPFAVAIARFRLLVTALQAAGLTRLNDAPHFTLHLAVGDALLHGTRGDRLPFSAEADLRATLAHRYPTEDSDEANRLLEAGRYHVAVGNPPYITVKDAALSRAYRGALPGRLPPAVPAGGAVRGAAVRAGPAAAGGPAGRHTRLFHTSRAGRPPSGTSRTTVARRPCVATTPQPRQPVRVAVVSACSHTSPSTCRASTSTNPSIPSTTAPSALSSTST